MKWIALALGTGLLAAAAGAEPPAPPAPAGGRMAGLGAQLYGKYCASCHGATAVGDGPVARALARPPADLTRIAARRGGQFPDGEIAHFIDGRFELAAHGTREMPVWGRKLADPIAEDASGEEVARGRIDLLVDYLKSIQRPAEAPKP